MQTSIALDHERTPDGRAHVARALLTIAGRAPRDAEHTPLNLSIVLDRSGSMAGPKLEQAKEAAALLVRRLWPDDVVSVVAYDDNVRTVAEPAAGAAQADLSERIQTIAPGGMTNLSGGWLRGRELVAGGVRDGAVNRVILLTDGLANVGITEPAQLAGLCRTALDQRITTTTIGFGDGYDEELLRRMAEAGGGNTWYIENPDQAPAIFAEEIDDLLSLSAQNLTVELRPASAARLVLVHHRYPSQVTPTGTRLDLGDLYARAPRTLLAEFVVSADVLMENGGVERQEVRLPIRASFAGGPRVDPEVRREMLLQEAARARDAAREAHDRGDDDAAGLVLRELSDKLSLNAREDLVLEEEAADLKEMAAVFRERRATAADAKYLHMRSLANATSRRGAAEIISRAKRKREPDE